MTQIPEQLELLPQHSWTEDAALTVLGSAKRLRRWGTVQQACAMLDDCAKETLYDLIHVGSVAAYKLRPHAKNSHWKVDLLSVWDHKTSQIAALRRA